MAGDLLGTRSPLDCMTVLFSLPQGMLTEVMDSGTLQMVLNRVRQKPNA